MREPIDINTVNIFRIVAPLLCFILIGTCIGLAIGSGPDANLHTLKKYAGYGALVGTLPLLLCSMSLAAYLSFKACKTYSEANDHTSPLSGSTNDEETTNEGVWSKLKRGVRHNLPSLFSGGPERPDVHQTRYPTEGTGDQQRSLLSQQQP